MLQKNHPVGNMNEVALRVAGVSKRYGGLVALDDVSFEVRHGEVVGLVGDNGAGKSTLLKIMSGAIAPSAGHIEVKGARQTFASPADAAAVGVSTVYQDLALSPQRDVTENFFLGRELLSCNWLGSRLGWLDKAAMRETTRAKLAELRVKIRDLDAQCGSLSGGQRQALAIARAAAWCSSALLLDEPTSALGAEQHSEVLELIRHMRASGRAVVLISHQMPDILTTCDRVLVLRLGRIVAVLEREQINADDLVGYITGATRPAAA